VLAGLLMSLLYLGGEAAQMTLNLPSSTTGLFQGVLLFFLLGVDVLIRYRIRYVSNPSAATVRAPT
jgi:general nucleoside transport system permease protein